MRPETETGKMTPEMLDRFLAGPHLARLATADPVTRQPHVVPVWYVWHEGSLWISSFASTRKVKELEENPLCSIVIDTASTGYTNEAAILEGRADLVRLPRDLVHRLSTLIYTRYLGEDGVQDPDPQSWIHDPENLLIRLTPTTVRTWYSREI
jgi:nitroimidazol reductase NimA-like FMN-containing flavoprotein (pyridoxamine 5'-phosphate oxidase superfamily)